MRPHTLLTALVGWSTLVAPYEIRFGDNLTVSGGGTTWPAPSRFQLVPVVGVHSVCVCQEETKS